jgi:hypothetical protein
LFSFSLASLVSSCFFIFSICLSYSGLFYGFIPAGAVDRKIIQVGMFALASCQLLARSIGCALIAAAVGKLNLGFMLGAELAVYLLYKVIRRDFYYWAPNNGITRVIVSFVIRSVVKIIADL